MAPKSILPRKKIADFIDNLYDGDLHAKRVLSLANATLGVLVSASLAVHAIGQGLAQALGKLSKHGVKQVDRLLSNQGIDVWEFFGYWVPYLVGARLEVVVAMDWTSFARDQQDTVVLSMLTGHGRATPLMWRTVRSSTLKGVGGCEKPRINGEHKIWGLTSGDDVFSQIGRLVAGSSLPAMNTRCVRTLGRVTRRAGAQRRSREEA